MTEEGTWVPLVIGPSGLELKVDDIATKLRDEARWLEENTEYKRTASTMQSAVSEIEHLRKWLKEVKLLTAAYADDYEGWPLMASVHRAARVGLKETS